MIVKIFFNFAIGILISIFFHLIFVNDLPFPSLFISGTALVTLYTTGSSLSKQVRCITILTIPSFFSKVGKTIIHAIIMTNIMSGPITNMAENADQIVKTISCSASLSYNYTRLKLDFMLKPFVAASMKIKPDYSEINTTMKILDNLAIPITKEMGDTNQTQILTYKNTNNDTIDYISDDDDNDEDVQVSKIDADKYEFQYINKVKERCKTMIKNAKSKCDETFIDAYEKCMVKALFVGKLLCWPIQLTVVCSMVKIMGEEKICDAKEHIDPGLGEEYVKLLSNSKTFKNDFQDVRFNYKAHNDYAHIFSMYETKKKIANMLENILNIIENIINYTSISLHLLCSALFLIAIMSAQSYHNNFHINIEFDNKYIDNYFLKIDNRRKARKQISLLPLNKIEKEKFIYSDFVSLLKNIKILKILECFFSTLCKMIVPVIIIILDMFLYESLQLVKLYGEISEYQKGSHSFNLKVKGIGMMSSLVKSMLKEFNQTSNINTINLNTECLPKPSQTANKITIIIIGLYVAMFLISLLNSYANHYKRWICANFYKKQQKRRILYLYNGIMKERFYDLRKIR